MEEVFVAYGGLLLLATIAIYAGAWGSLPPPRNKSGANAEDDEDERDFDERLSSSDAYIFPLLASAALFGIYIVFKFLGTEWINWLIGWYFAVMGVGSIWQASIALLRTVVGQARWKSFDRTRILIVKNKRERFSISFRTPTPFLLPWAVLPSTIYMFSKGTTKPVLMTNVLSLSFAYNSLCLLKLDSFQTGAILLTGLFLYDIWWVFGTEVMVKVATSLDAPIKILWPKSSDFSAVNGFAMLGLGDIVIPGIFITLALRRDLSVSSEKNPYGSFAKPYFIAAMLSYVLGLVCTMAVMHTFKAAQPALLYLSPACILSFVITGLRRGELKEVWQWRDEAEKKTEIQDLKVLEPVLGDIPASQGLSATEDGVLLVDDVAAEPEPVTGDGEKVENFDDKPKRKKNSRKKREQI